MAWERVRIRVAIAAVIGAAFLIPWAAAKGTCTTGWVAPNDDDTHEGYSWDNGVGGRYYDDDEWASTTLNGDEHEYDDYNFASIPDGAVVTGFEVRIFGYSDGGPGSVQVALSLNGGGELEMPAGPSPWSIGLPTGLVGDAAWGTVAIPNPPAGGDRFTREEVCSGNDMFTVWVKANVGGTAIYVDAVQVRVTYYDETVGPEPDNPSPSSPTHTTGNWYNASTLPPSGTSVTMNWTTASDNPACASGIGGYRVMWDGSSSTELGASDGLYFDEDESHAQAFFLSEGESWFHIRSIDNADYLAQDTAHFGPFRYDDTWPTNPNVTSSRATGTWINSADVPISVSGASDSPSGVDGFAFAWTHAGTWTQDHVKDREEAWAGETFSLPADGVWYFHLATVDNAANWTASSVYETEGWFGVDTHAPSDPTVSSPTHAEGARSSNPNVQIAVSGAADPVYGESGYQASSGVDGFSVVWDHSPAGVPDTTKDQEENWTGTTTTLADGTWYYHLRTKDNAGNWTSTEDYGPIILDTDPPGVSAVTPNLGQIADANVGAGTFTVTVDFDEAMDTGVNPTLTFAPTVSSTLAFSGGSWTDADSYRATYNVADANIDVNSVTIDVTGAQDLVGLPQEDYTPVHEFDIDTLNPTVEVNIVDTQLYDGDDASSVTFTFSESTVDFTVGDVSATNGVTSGFSGSGTSYSATFTAPDGFDGTGSVSVAAGTYTDAAGNAGGAGSDAVDIDTLNPTVSITVNDAAIYDGDVGSDRWTARATYSEPMNPGEAPMLTLTPNPSTTLTNPSGAWSGGNTIYTWTYDIADAGVTIDDIDIGVSGGTDVAGNLQVPNTATDLLDIDTENPIVSGASIVNNTIVTNDYVKNGDSATITATVTDAKLSDGDTSYIRANLTGLGGGSSVSAATYVGGTATWNLPSVSCSPTNGTVTVTVTAHDRSGNAQVAPSSDTIIADNIDPVIGTVLITNTAIPSTSCIKDGQPATITAQISDTNLESGDTAYITANLSRLGGGAAESPSSYDGATATWAIGSVNCTPADGPVTVTVDAFDRAYNAAAQRADSIVADNTVPTIAEITASPASGCFREGENVEITVHFSESVTLAAGGSLTVHLDSGGSATIAPFTWQNSAAGTYTVGSGENSCDLSATSLSLLGTLRDCPWNDTDLTIPAGHNIDDASADKDVVVDNTSPTVVFDGFFDDWSCTMPHTTPSATEYWVDDACGTYVYFRATVADNCSIPAQFIDGAASGISVDVELSCGTSEHLTFVEGTDVTLEANDATHPTQIVVRGRARVCCLPSCPASTDLSEWESGDGCAVDVRIDIGAVDCADNEDEGMTPVSPAVATVVDEDPAVRNPVPRDDPMQNTGGPDESAVLENSLVEVRLDEFGTYRLVFRESSPERIDVLVNDVDNCSESSGGCGCCGSNLGDTLAIYDIVDAPDYGTATIEDPFGDCRGGSRIRYAPDHGYLGPDSFTYRVIDPCGNISDEATVYIQMVEETLMEDVAVIACSGEPTEFEVVAADLWVDRDPVTIPFAFSIVSGPTHGILLGDPNEFALLPPSVGPDPTSGALVPTLDFTEAAVVQMAYVSALGYLGRDSVIVRFEDPFGAFATAEVDLMVIDCASATRAAPEVGVERGVILPIVAPMTFGFVAEFAPGAVILTSVSTGLHYSSAVSIAWVDDLARYTVVVDTGPLPADRYWLSIPLGTDERVLLILEVGEAQ